LSEKNKELISNGIIVIYNFIPLFKLNPTIHPMKTNLIHFLAASGLLIAFTSCSGPQTVPFHAEFTGTYTAIVPDSILCGPGVGLNVTVDGTGTGEPTGNFTIHFNFCVDSLGYYPGNHIVGEIVTETGDSLYVKCAGQVIEGKAEDHPDYVVSYWRDPFEILGGTGKFEGATGEGTTDDYNSSEDPNSHHHWMGTITLQKGKKG
jgi:hypothetical protein